MKNAYYYLIASLPMLEFGKAPGIPYADFLTQCSEQLVPADMEIIHRASVEPPADAEDEVEMLREWKKFDTALRNDLAIARAIKKGKDPKIYVRGLEKSSNVFLGHHAHWALNQESLLDAELYLDRIRWEKIEELSQGHYFDIEYLVKYALHSQILERWRRIHSTRGMELLQNVGNSSAALRL